MTNEDIKTSAYLFQRILLIFIFVQFNIPAFTQNVGIGTTTPGERLTIKSADDIPATNILNILANNLTQGIAIGYDEIRKTGINTNSNLNINARGTGYLLLQNSSTGYVGIGGVPLHKLHVMDPVANGRVIYGENTYVGTADGYGVYGRSVNSDAWGFGGYFQGGYVGAFGTVAPTGSSSYTGLWGEVSGGSGTNYGVKGIATGTGINYGIYGSASSGSAKFAGYFDNGDVYIKNNLGIGATSIGSRLYVASPDNVASTNIVNFLANNLTQGIAMGWDEIRKSGTTPDSDLKINAKGAGNLILQNTSTGNVGIGTAPSYKLQVNDPDASAVVLLSENSYVGNAHGTAIYGSSINNPGYGQGVYGQGGQTGVNGYGNGSNASKSTGVYGVADGSSGLRVGVEGMASGGSTNYGLLCTGSGAYTGSWTNISDQKFKRDISTFNHALELVTQLHPVSYQLKTDEYPMMHFPSFRQYGFVAQELEKVIPLLVENGMHAGATGEDENLEFKTVNYIGMIPILTRAIQEQQVQIEEMKTVMLTLLREMEDLKKNRQP